jgi:hypothetical protein
MSTYNFDAGSALNQGLSKRDALKLANKASKSTTVEKAQLFPTLAVGSSLTPYVNPETVTADFYRFGKFLPDQSGYEIPRKQFDPIVNDKLTSSIRVIGQDSKSNKQVSIIPAYTKFILENVQESHAERSQIIETFGDFYVFMFGERPSVYNFSGQLVNAKNANWVMDFMFMYNEYLRGTRCVERNAKIVLTYGGRQIEGLMLNVATVTNAAVEGAVGLQFSVVVFERKYFNFSEDMGYSSADNMTLTEDSAFRKTIGLIAGPEGKGSSGNELSKAIGKVGNFAKGGAANGLMMA